MGWTAAGFAFAIPSVVICFVLSFFIISKKRKAAEKDVVEEIGTPAESQ